MARTFGLSMAESLVNGNPLIGTNKCSIPKIVKNGENGFLFNSILKIYEKVINISKK